MNPERPQPEETIVPDAPPPETVNPGKEIADALPPSEECGSPPAEEVFPEAAVSEEASPEESSGAETSFPSPEENHAEEAPTDPEAAASPVPPSDELNALREEVKALRAEIAQKDAFYAKADREYTEFRTLYPDTDLHTLPDSVWDEVRRGTPLAAAFALSERRRTLALAAAEESNRQNKSRSPGTLQGGAEDEFSISEVRAMSPSEIRSQFDRVMRSLQKWH